MSLFHKIFGKKDIVTLPDFLKVDMHSHLLPDLDDGSKTLEETVEMLKRFSDLGYKKLVTTPHIMGDFYKNDKNTIIPVLAAVREQIKINNIPIELEAAAEYYLDEWFIEKLEKEEPLLTIGKKHVLIETSYINESSQLHKSIFLLRSLGYTPILAHPERYTYLYNSFDNFKRLYEMEVLFQINLISLNGYYSKQSKIFAEKLIDNNMVHFVGSDCHGHRHLDGLKMVMAGKYYKKLENMNLHNNSLLV